MWISVKVKRAQTRHSQNRDGVDNVVVVKPEVFQVLKTRQFEKISDGVARRSSGYTRTKPLHEGPLQKRNREMALARRARPVLQQPDMTF